MDYKSKLNVLDLIEAAIILPKLMALPSSVTIIL